MGQRFSAHLPHIFPPVIPSETEGSLRESFGGVEESAVPGSSTNAEGHGFQPCHAQGWSSASALHQPPHPIVIPTGAEGFASRTLRRSGGICSSRQQHKREGHGFQPCQLRVLSTTVIPRSPGICLARVDRTLCPTSPCAPYQLWRVPHPCRLLCDRVGNLTLHGTSL